ncbi:MAG: CocE/NonD family hydrolase [Ferruginibacter sp.]
MIKYLLTGISLLTTGIGYTQTAFVVKDNFTKTEVYIPMRDGVKLYTAIYTPKISSGPMPFLMERTPYSSGPYGDTLFPRRLGPNEDLAKAGYIFVYQDVRGRYLSEGINLEVTPYLPVKKSKKDVDESSDTWDTIDWLLKNVKNNNGKVGIYGISYPGFYSTAALPGAHPALKAVSPQAPVTDEFIGDDANHNGAFFLMDNFSFMNYFGKPRTGPVKDYGKTVFPFGEKDMYRFFLELNTLDKTNAQPYFNDSSYIWNEYLQHDTYDAYWQARNIRPYLKNITIPTLVVGGWFDAEDLFGALQTYKSIETQSPVNKNYLVMGPWTHGAWASSDWNKYAALDFGSNTSKYFRDSLETPFFNYYLKGQGTFEASEASIFETGSNTWRHFKQWPPVNMVPTKYYFNEKGSLSTQATELRGSDEYLSDPNKPVPYTNGIFGSRNNDYMAEDQRFAGTRPDVLVYETGILENDVILAGNIVADLRVSLTGSDADFIVKLIDVLPDDEPNFKNAPRGFQMAGYQRLVRAEVMRGKFRDSYVKPAPFIPGKITTVKINLNDVAHNFKKGHRIMVQVQSTWFPLVDRNPQQFMRIPDAKAEDFQKAFIKIYHDEANASRIVLPVLK